MTETPQLGKEYLQPGEEKDIEAIIEMIRRYLKKVYAPGKLLRQFHPKMHGFVSAQFRVDPDLPTAMRHGVLQPGKVYNAWVRFSNGNSRVSDDHKADLRGMAIKLLDVPGEMLEADPRVPQSQDILLVSYPTLMSPDIASFKKNVRAICGGPLAMVWFGLNPMNWPTLARTLRSMKKTSSLFGLQYWSVAPSRLGTGDQAVKYSAIPASRPAVFGTDRRNPNYLRDNMQQELSTRPFLFDFFIQFQEDAISMPIENPCVEWKSKWHKAGQIILHEQVFNTAERDHAGEQATFSPWHSLPEHRPLGGVSRARRKVYAAISAFRLENNQKV